MMAIICAAIAREMIAHVLQYERLGRQLELLGLQLVTQRHWQALMDVGYRMGEGTTGTRLAVWQQTEDLR